jgi:hypothetical protein
VKYLKLLTFTALLVLLPASSALAANISATSVGTNKKITVATQRIDILGGGRFSGDVGGDDTFFWCVDNENEIEVPTTYFANVTMLSDWSGGVNAEVRKGTETHWVWSPSSVSLSALQRYQIAAYLISETNAYSNGTYSRNDEKYQQAAWEILDVWDRSLRLGREARHVLGDAVDYVLHQDTDFGFGQWAVVSGEVKWSSSELSECKRIQTLMVRVDPVPPPPYTQIPEPGALGLAGPGLMGLALLRWRRSGSSTGRKPSLF